MIRRIWGETCGLRGVRRRSRAVRFSIVPHRGSSFRLMRRMPRPERETILTDRLIVAVALGVVAVLGAPAGAQHWPSFRGPQASGVLDGSDPPASWDVTRKEHVRWQTAI